MKWQFILTWQGQNIHVFPQRSDILTGRWSRVVNKRDTLSFGTMEALKGCSSSRRPQLLIYGNQTTFLNMKYLLHNTVFSVSRLSAYMWGTFKWAGCVVPKRRSYKIITIDIMNFQWSHLGFKHWFQHLITNKPVVLIARALHIN